MKDDTIYFKDKPFDTRVVEELSMESVRLGLEQGNLCLQFQFETIDKIRNRCVVILGWLVGAVVALAGYIALEATSAHPELVLLITAGYELGFSFAISVVIIYGTMYKRRVFFPGDAPSHFFHDSILSYLKGNETIDEVKCLVGYYLNEIQFRIIRNKEEQMHEVKIYRRALALIFVGLISGTILLFVLLLLFP